MGCHPSPKESQQRAFQSETPLRLLKQIHLLGCQLQKRGWDHYMITYEPLPKSILIRRRSRIDHLFGSLIGHTDIGHTC